MTRYAAFLRGMNVGGHRITNDELKAAFGRVGFAGVATFRASGNVVLDADDGEDRTAVAQRIEEGLLGELGYEVPVFLRTAAELLAMATHEPFDAAALAATKGKLQVMLLTGQPDAQVRRDALAHASDDDRLAFAASELYWLPRGGMSDSELDLDAIGRLVGLTTMRTKGTIDLIAARHFAGG